MSWQPYIDELVKETRAKEGALLGPNGHVLATSNHNLLDKEYYPRECSATTLVPGGRISNRISDKTNESIWTAEACNISTLLVFDPETTSRDSIEGSLKGFIHKIFAMSG